MTPSPELVIQNEPQYEVIRMDIMNTVVKVEQFLEMRDYYRQALSTHAEEARKKAIEEAAKVAERCTSENPYKHKDIAQAIRKLVESKP